MAKRTPVGTIGKGRRGISVAGWALRGAAAGAAGSTALNAVTYLDMVVRGRGTSSTPEQTVEKLAEKAHVRIPGDEEKRSNRVQGLGPMTGLVAGVGVGVGVGLLRAAGFRSQPLVGTLLTTLGVLVAANGPMTVLGVTDPRTWSATDWASDIVPHLAYGAVVKTTMDAFDRL
jgi:F0F1-type ATP synthase assembly protein I